MCIPNILSPYSIPGFIKFTEGYYIYLITKRSVVALIGGHYVYHIDETLLLPIGQPTKHGKNSDEARYVAWVDGGMNEVKDSWN